MPIHQETTRGKKWSGLTVGERRVRFRLLPLLLLSLHYSRGHVSSSLLQDADDLTDHCLVATPSLTAERRAVVPDAVLGTMCLQASSQCLVATLEEGSELVCHGVGIHIGGSGSDCLGMERG